MIVSMSEGTISGDPTDPVAGKDDDAVSEGLMSRGGRRCRIDYVLLWRHDPCHLECLSAA